MSLTRKVWSRDETVKKFIVAKDFQEFKDKVKTAFSLTMVRLEISDGTEIEDSAVFDILDKEEKVFVVPTVMTSGADRLDSGIVVPTPVITWPSMYTIPEFPDRLRTQLCSLKENTKLHERLMSTIIRILHEDMLKFFPTDSAYPTARQYEHVCESLIHKYPFLADDSASCTGIDFWRKKLKRKFKDYRKNLVSPEVLEMRQKYTTAKKRSTITSSAAAEAIPPPSPVKRSKVPSAAAADTEIEYVQTAPESEEVHEMLARTREMRMQSIIAAVLDPVSEMRKWPDLFTTEHMYTEALKLAAVECGLGMGRCPASQVFETGVEKLLVTLGKAFQTMLKEYKKAQPYLKKHQGQDDDMSLSTLGLMLLPLSLGEIQNHLYYEKEDLQDVSKKLVLVIHKNSITISLNRTEIIQRSTPAEALAAFFSLHHILAIHYQPKSCMTLLEYCAGLKCKSKIKVAAVTTLIDKLSLSASFY